MDVPKRSTLIKALKIVSRTRVGDPGFAFDFVVNEHSHRTIAVSFAALVEHSLRVGLEQRMIHLSADELRDMFGERGPLSDFGSKVQIAYAFGIVGSQTKLDCGVIREVRNAFVHSFPI